MILLLHKNIAPGGVEFLATVSNNVILTFSPIWNRDLGFAAMLQLQLAISYIRFSSPRRLFRADQSIYSWWKWVVSIWLDYITAAHFTNLISNITMKPNIRQLQTALIRVPTTLHCLTQWKLNCCYVAEFTRSNLNNRFSSYLISRRQSQSVLHSGQSFNQHVSNWWLSHYASR